MIKFALKIITIEDMELLEYLSKTFNTEIEVEYTIDSIIIEIKGGRL